MISARTPKATGLALAALAALPALAAAHPSVYTDTARVVASGGGTTGQPVVFGPDQTRYVVANHGYTYVLRESNALTTGGIMDFKRLPGAYRATIPHSQWFTEGGSGAQPHATCTGVAALASEEAVKSWQDADPFYAYIPFQSGGAGLDDDPASWIGQVQARTGVNLASVPDPAAACTGLGGTFVPADTTQSRTAGFNPGTIAATEAPLKAQIATLETRVATAEAQGQASTNRFFAPLRVAVGSGALTRTDLTGAGIPVGVTGVPGTVASVRVLMSAADAKKHGLKYRTIGRAPVTIGLDGTGTASVKALTGVAAKLARHDEAFAVTVDAISTRRAVATGTLTR